MGASKPTTDARAEFIVVDRGIEFARARIVKLERLLSDSQGGASPSVVRRLLGEWRDRLRSLQSRREELVGAMVSEKKARGPGEIL